MALPLIRAHQRVTTLLFRSVYVQTVGTLEMRVMNGRKERKDGGRRRRPRSNLRHNAGNYLEGPKKRHENPKKGQSVSMSKF
jgi:hypothetical protein